MPNIIKQPPPIHTAFDPVYFTLGRYSNVPTMTLVARYNDGSTEKIPFSVEMYDAQIVIDISEFLLRLFKPMGQENDRSYQYRIESLGGIASDWLTVIRARTQVGDYSDFTALQGKVLSGFTKLTKYEGYPLQSSRLAYNENGDPCVVQATASDDCKQMNENVTCSGEFSNFVPIGQTDAVFTFFDGSMTKYGDAGCAGDWLNFGIKSFINGQPAEFEFSEYDPSVVTDTLIQNNGTSQFCSFSVNPNFTREGQRIVPVKLRQVDTGNEISFIATQASCDLVFEFWGGATSYNMGDVSYNGGQIVNFSAWSSAQGYPLGFGATSYDQDIIDNMFVNHVENGVWAISFDFKPNDTDQDRPITIVFTQMSSNLEITITMNQKAFAGEFTFYDGTNTMTIPATADAQIVPVSITSKVSGKFVDFSVDMSNADSGLIDYTGGDTEEVPNLFLDIEQNLGEARSIRVPIVRPPRADEIILTIDQEKFDDGYTFEFSDSPTIRVNASGSIYAGAIGITSRDKDYNPVDFYIDSELDQSFTPKYNIDSDNGYLFLWISANAIQNNAERSQQITLRQAGSGRTIVATITQGPWTDALGFLHDGADPNLTEVSRIEGHTVFSSGLTMNLYNSSHQLSYEVVSFVDGVRADVTLSDPSQLDNPIISEFRIDDDGTTKTAHIGIYENTSVSNLGAYITMENAAVSGSYVNIYQQGVPEPEPDPYTFKFQGTTDNTFTADVIAEGRALNSNILNESLFNIVSVGPDGSPVAFDLEPTVDPDLLFVNNVTIGTAALPTTPIRVFSQANVVRPMARRTRLLEFTQRGSGKKLFLNMEQRTWTNALRGLTVTNNIVSLSPQGGTHTVTRPRAALANMPVDLVAAVNGAPSRIQRLDDTPLSNPMFVANSFRWVIVSGFETGFTISLTANNTGQQRQASFMMSAGSNFTWVTIIQQA